MAISRGRVSEVRFGCSGELEGLVTCPPGIVPAVGRYLSAYAPAESEAPLPTPLFQTQLAVSGFWVAPPFPSSWIPGTELVLRGPLGKGFEVPRAITRLALACLGVSPARLLPLAREALERDCAVTLFCDTPPPSLPSTLEIYPLDSLREALSWPDVLALDLPIERLPALRSLLALPTGQPLPCPIQILTWTAMPCAGIGECGACAVPTRRGHKLACSDGPVFPLDSLEW